MPELYARAIKKWPNSYSGAVPTIDFSNGVRVRDIAIDTDQSPNWIWVCIDNTIGSPVWVREEFPSSGTVPDNDVTSFPIGNPLVDGHIVLTYTLKGGSFNHEGWIRISHDGSDVCLEEEYGGPDPIHNIVVSADISGGTINLIFDTTSPVGTTLDFVYNVINRLPL